MENGNSGAVVVGPRRHAPVRRRRHRRRRAARRLARRAKGNLTAVMGPSGSGKSTLMHILAGLDKPTSGTVAISGTEITKLSDSDLTKLRRRHIGFVFQFFNLLPMLTAEENITLPLSIAGEKADPEFFERADRERRPGRPPPSPALRALRRSAAARRDRPRPRLEADGPLRRRAHGQPRLEDGHRDPRPAARLRRRLRPDDRDGHARAARGGHRRPRPLPRRRPDRQGPSPLDPAARFSRRSRRSRRRDQVRAEGSVRPQAAHGLDRGRDRARGRDGERHLRPHRLDRPGVRRDLQRDPPGLGRRDHRQVGFRPLATAAAATRRRSTSPCSRRSARSRVCSGRGSVTGDSAADRQAGQGDRRRRADARLLRSREGDSPFNPLTLVEGAWPGRERGRDRRGDRQGRRTSRSATDRRPGRGPGRAVPISGLSVRLGLDDRRRHAAGFTCRGTAAVRQGRPARRDRCRGRSRVSRRSSSSRTRAGPPARPRRSAGVAGDRGREGHEQFITFLQGFLLAFAASRSSSALRDRELARDHDRAADAGVRDDQDARRVTKAGARSIVIEALVVGTLASVVGLFSGLAPREGPLPASSTPSASRCRTPASCFETRTIIVSLLVGIIVTLLASLRPAIRATRVPPIAAVREGATLPESRFAPFRTIGSLGLTGLGFAALAYGLFGSGPRHDPDPALDGHRVHEEGQPFAESLGRFEFCQY